MTLVSPNKQPWLEAQLTRPPSLSIRWGHQCAGKPNLQLPFVGLTYDDDGDDACDDIDDDDDVDDDVVVDDDKSIILTFRMSMPIITYKLHVLPC